MIAAYKKQTWIWIGAIVIIFLIGFSRIYLGAHFPHDVVFGWFLGAIVLWSFTSFWEPVGTWVRTKTLNHQIFIAFIVSLIFVVIGLGVAALRSKYQVPENWINNAMLADAELPAPVHPNDIFPRGDGFIIYTLRFIRYALVGGWVAGGAPWAFMRLKLAEHGISSI